MKKLGVLKHSTLTSLLVLICLANISPVAAESESSLALRVERIEELMGSGRQLQLLSRIRRLQQENQQLRSLLEEQDNSNQIFQQQQRDIYSNFNRRLKILEVTESTKQADSQASLQINSQTMLQKDPQEREVEALQSVPTDIVKDKTRVEPKPMSAAERGTEKTAYQRAYNELRTRNYNQARDSFTLFLQRYPEGHYARLAQYWIAEASYVQQQYQQAIIDYQRLLDNYPQTPKKAEAELKKAFSYYELGDKNKAQKNLRQLLVDYPKTTEAGQARRLLKKL